MNARTTVALVGLIVAIVGMARGFSGSTVDSRVFLTAGERFVEGGELYRQSDGTMPFKYAPPVAMVFAPLSVLPQRLGCMAWGILGGALFALAARRWLALLGVTSARVAGLASLGCATSFYFEQNLGQSDLLMFWLLTEAYWQAERRPWLSGAAFAVAAAFKPPALILAPILVARDWRVIAGGAIAAIGGVGAVLLRYGSADSFGAWQQILATTTPPWFLGARSQSLGALVHELLGRPAPQTMADLLPAQLLAIALTLAALWPLRRRPQVLAACCFWAAAVLSPLAWVANYCLGWPVWLVLASSQRRAAWVALGAAFIVQTVLADKVLPSETVFALLAYRPFTWLFVIAIGAVNLCWRAPVRASRCAET